MLQDKIAKRILNRKQASGWFVDTTAKVEEFVETEYKTAKLLIGDIEVSCMIADDQDLQIQGLQGHKELGPYDAMIFPYQQPRRVAFHMGKVSFPIDIIFVADDSRVSRIVENVEPGQSGQWGMPHISAVIEVNGGFCQAHNIQVGSEVGQVDRLDAMEAELEARIAQISNTDINIAWDQFLEGSPTPLDPIQDEAIKIIKRLININGAGEREAILPAMETPSGKWLMQLGLVEMKKSYSDPTFFSEAEPMKMTPRPPLPFLTPLGKNFAYGLGRERSRYSPRNVKPGAPMKPVVKGRLAQETFPSYPRKDINPKMVAPNTTNPSDRFLNRDLMDNQMQDQVSDSSKSFDLNVDIHDEDNGIGPNVRSS